MKNTLRIVMESRGIPSSVWFCYLSVDLVRSQFGEGGGGLTSEFPWLFLDWFIHEIPHSCLEYGTMVTG